jgi:hypothetical protein
MNSIGGYCQKCGAPFYVPSVWHGIIPPQPIPTCNCWNVSNTTYTTDTVCDYNFKSKEIKDPSKMCSPFPTEGQDEECIVAGCKNRKSQGKFVGDICSSCYEMITTGDASKNSTNFIHSLCEKNKKKKKKIKEMEQTISKFK